MSEKKKSLLRKIINKAGKILAVIIIYNLEHLTENYIEQIETQELQHIMTGINHIFEQQ